ncbi:hypothetical protein Q4595_06495 [Wenyingzhuangia sp. 1_MG-2023]|nr:hypothetical protein [Wenyingzhuangia sp. 1_MG-2023]
MKKLIVLFSAVVLLQFSANAAINHYEEKPFVFVENNVEYAVFKDGQFDFNIIPKSNNIHINTRNINVSFNTGQNYTPYIKHNRNGEIVQIENTSIFYDYYGRVNRIGNVSINYNRYGFINNIGNLTVYYHQNGAYNRSVGYVNRYNINYRPYRTTYTRPVTKRRVVVYNKPKYYPSNKYYANKYNKKNKYTSKKTKEYNSTKSSQKKSAKTEYTTKDNSESSVAYSKRENSNSYRRK